MVISTDLFRKRRDIFIDYVASRGTILGLQINATSLAGSFLGNLFGLYPGGTLNKFRSSKWIEIESKRVTIHNVGALEELVKQPWLTS